MSFLAPMAFAFAATLPVVVLFYLLKRRRVVRVVPSTILWQRFLAETQASAPFQKLRHNWLLLLQLLLLILAVLALTRPYFAGKSTGGRLEVVILDASASMQSTDVAPSRFARAQEQALELVASMQPSDRMVVLQAGAETKVKQNPTSDKSALRAAIQAAEPSDGPTRLAEALKLAETLIRTEAHPEIHLFSDGAVPELNEFENANLPLTYHRVGERSENSGIVTLDVRPNPENPLQRAVFTSVSNASSNQVETAVELLFNDTVIEARSVAVPARGTAPAVFVTDQTEDGVFSVRLTAEDDLAADNQASIVSLLPQPAKVLLVTGGNRFLEKALRAAGRVDLTVATDYTPGADPFDLVVLDNITPTSWPTENVLAIHVAAPGWFDSVESIEAPIIVDWRSAHPLLRSVSFDTVQIAEGLAAETPSWAVSLVDSPQRALILSGELGRQRIVWIGFDIMQSTWPLRISFPIFIANAVDWLNPASANAKNLLVQAGSPFRMALSEKLESVQVQLPDGDDREWEVNESTGELIFGETQKQGVYRVNAGTNELVFCVNLLDTAETDILPKSQITFGRYVAAETTAIRRANMEVWRWFAAVALAVLLFEWWFYHQRTAG